MYVSKEDVLSSLPAYKDEWLTIKRRQEVKDIINELLDAHQHFASYYDRIWPYFQGLTINETCKNLYDFCKQNIKYKEETEELQISSQPTGMLIRGYGDCKAYATFIGGVLDAIKRNTGENIDWHYCFASYKIEQRTPYHIFVVVNTSGGEIWVDPTPGADGKTPVWIINKKIGSMALVRNIAGVSDTAEVDKKPSPLVLVGAALALWLLIKNI